MGGVVNKQDMIGTISFDLSLPEEYDKMTLYMKSEDMAVAIHRVRELLRSYLKYLDLSAETRSTLERLQEEILGLLDMYGVNEELS